MYMLVKIFKEADLVTVRNMIDKFHYKNLK